MRRCFVNPNDDPDALAKSLADPGMSLRQGGLVAFPTETVYGLGANAFDETAVCRIFAAKRRPVDNPLIVHIASLNDLDGLLPSDYRLGGTERRLIDQFWPGPLTILFPAGEHIAPSVHPGRDLVGVRMPQGAVARALIAQAQVPVAAPSANVSGKPSPTTADDVAEDLAEHIDWLVDGGECALGVESTVLLVEEERAVILRPGGVTQEMLASVIDIPVVFDRHLFDPAGAPLAPGMKYRHYAPDAKVHVWWGEEEAIYAAMREFMLDEDGRPWPQMRPAIIAPRDFLSRYEIHMPSDRLGALPPDDYSAELARSLYQLLRRFDRAEATDVLVYGVDPAHGIGTAVMNRLQKAAEGRVVLVGY
ncbi:L-threonylcarbamoyladenylate synthase [Alicyclobacillus acidiphilus]|uniref:L-threonylcarbamoyladenylate synthase n=1 Tax=Alicyclobacillus acidiphilus TaxID=182455 RepID=UPI00082A8BA3|nr:L-threonylcarbamoyladenylate synthase [Alicyclobacillus acidiphilus]